MAEVIRLGGTVSGEHGDGRLRARFLERQYGPEVMELFRRVKTAFDPDGIFNPGVILPEGVEPPLGRLKMGPEAAELPPDIGRALREIERTGGYARSRLALADEVAEDGDSDPTRHTLTLALCLAVTQTLGLNVIRAPTVTLIARPQFVEPPHLPVQWKGEATDGERLAEFAGRLCYMSQRNPAGRSTAEYLANILKQGHGSVFEHAVYVLLLEGIIAGPAAMSWSATGPGSDTASCRSATWTSPRPRS